TLKFTNNEPNSSIEKVPNFKKANFHKLRAMFKETDWSFLINNNDINTSWKLFETTYLKAVQDCIPSKIRRPGHNNKPKWWNTDISNCLLAKKFANDRLKSSQHDEEQLKCVELRRNAKKIIKQSKKTLELHIANQSKTNPKEFYSYIRKKKVVTSTVGPLVDENGEYTKDEVQMSNSLNTFFASVFTTEDLSDIPTPSPIQIDNSDVLSNITVTEREVLNCLDKLKVNKMPGPDTISPRVLKEAKDELSKPLTLLFNKSLQSGTMPDQWKLANVTPIFKKGSKSLPSNYRPISLTSVVCKMLETVIRDRLVNHLEENNILKDTQHGFRKKRSCLTNLLDFFHDILNLYDESKAVDIIYLDFQKAFDKVPHKRLLLKLKAHGIQDGVLKWI
ncbi:reverse transcriptase family protein, partial [Pseudomonas aeruginosa]|nr:reverse transcriptase family protein [Pseudomonas aeruginosa]